MGIFDSSNQSVERSCTQKAVVIDKPILLLGNPHRVRLRKLVGLLVRPKNYSHQETFFPYEQRAK